MKNLTEHFTWEEMTKSRTANKWSVSNDPPKELIPNLIKTCEGLERIRLLIGSKPIRVLSGYRSKETNILVGGSKRSQHVAGMAADIVAYQYGSVLDLARLIEKNMKLIGVDQVILEHGWVHVSFSDKPRFEALTLNDKGYMKGIA